MTKGELGPQSRDCGSSPFFDSYVSAPTTKLSGPHRECKLEDMGYCSSRFSPGEVHVWFAELTGDGSALETCLRSLSEDEKRRAAQFRSERLKTDFILVHGILRSMLGRYLGVSPDRVSFAYGPQGKPRLISSGAELTFNIAHSGRLAAYVVAAGCELGIDIEQVRPVDDEEALVRRFFTVEECDDWLLLDAAERDEAFFRCWTRKEAFIKALGDGLSRPLNSFRVSLGSSPVLMHIDGDPAAAGEWSLYSLLPAAGYIGALAVPEKQCSVSAFGPLRADELLHLTAASEAWPPAIAKGRLLFPLS